MGIAGHCLVPLHLQQGPDCPTDGVHLSTDFYAESGVIVRRG